MILSYLYDFYTVQLSQLIPSSCLSPSDPLLTPPTLGVKFLHGLQWAAIADLRMALQLDPSLLDAAEKLAELSAADILKPCHGRTRLVRQTIGPGLVVLVIKTAAFGGDGESRRDV